MRSIYLALAMVALLVVAPETSQAAGRGARGGAGGIGRSTGSSFGVGGVQRSVGPSFGAGGINRGGLTGPSGGFSPDRYGPGSTNFGRSNRSDPRRDLLNSSPMSRSGDSRYAAPPAGGGITGRDWSRQRQRLNEERNLEHRLGQADRLRAIGERNGNDRLFGTSDRMARQAQEHYERRLGHLGTAATGEPAAPYANLPGSATNMPAVGRGAAGAMGYPQAAHVPAQAAQRGPANWPPPTARMANRPGTPVNLPAAAGRADPYRANVPVQGGPPVQLPGRSIYAPALGREITAPPGSAQSAEASRSGFGSRLRRFWPFGG